jgi:hypothetical protein
LALFCIIRPSPGPLLARSTADSAPSLIPVIARSGATRQSLGGPLGEDLCFSGHDVALRTDRLLSMTHYSVAQLSYERHDFQSSEIRTMQGFYWIPMYNDKPLPERELHRSAWIRPCHFREAPP